MTNLISKYGVTVSLIVFLTSLLFPTYCSNVQCSPFLSGLTDLLFGWFAALFMGSTYIAWFANPFFITALFTVNKSPALSLFFSITSLAFALGFLKGGELWLNEAGHKGYIAGFQAGYWLWVASISVLLITSIFKIVKGKSNEEMLSEMMRDSSWRKDKTNS